MNILKNFQNLKNQQIFNKKKQKRFLLYLQNIGKSLMFPIAVLPFAAIFLRISELVPIAGDETGGTQFSNLINLIFSTIGNAVFGPVLPMLFAIGVAFGLSKDHRGECALMAFIGMILVQIFLSLPKQGFTGAGSGLVELIYGDVVVSLPQQPEVKGFANLFSRLNGNEKVSYYADIMVNNVLVGITVGILVSSIYNRFNDIELPSILSFFSGRRLVPVLTLIFGLIFSLIWVVIFPWIAWCIYFLSFYMQEATGNLFANAAIMGIFVFFNRLLIPFGMHHIPNTLFWFTLGSFPSNGVIVQGDINIFLKGDLFAQGYGYNNAGTFQSGFFPFMMFGLPALGFAFYKHAQDKTQAKKIAALLTGSTLVSFFTGITEPIEFLFLFSAPLLYFFHAVLAAFWAFIVGLMQIQIGFGFSAGFFDFVLSIPKSLAIIDAKVNGIFDNSGVMIAQPVYNQFQAIIANPLFIFLIGALCAVCYYFVVKLAIVKFHIDTPGRGKNIIVDVEQTEIPKTNNNSNFNSNKYTLMCFNLIKAIGAENIKKLDWCATRLRITVIDNKPISEQMLKKAGAKGVIKIGTAGLQVIIGTTVELVGNEMNRILQNKEILAKLTNK